MSSSGKQPEEDILLSKPLVEPEEDIQLSGGGGGVKPIVETVGCFLSFRSSSSVGEYVFLVLFYF